MKKLFYNTFVQMVLALFVSGFVACQEYDIDSQPEQPLNIQIDALDSYTALATSPSNVVFNISSNTPWSIQSDQQWCKVTPSMSASSSLVSEIVVSMEDNTTAQSRVAKLTVSAENIQETKVITINQVSKEKLLVYQYDDTVLADGGEAKIGIISNKPWEIITSDAFLANIDKKSGTGNENGTEETVTITLPANPGAKRTGTVLVRTEFEEWTPIEITQNGIVIEIENNPEGIIALGGGDGYNLTSTSVTIHSNTAWKVEVPEEYQDWLSAEAVSETELKVSVTTNNRLTTRTGKLVMKTKEAAEGFDGVEFTVNQSIAFWFSQGEANRVVDAATGNLKMNFVTGNNMASNYLVKKGHLTFEFEEIHFTGNNILNLNMYPNVGNANYRLELGQTTKLASAGGFNWTAPVTKALTLDEINAVKKIEFYVEEDPDNAGFLRIRVLLDGVEILQHPKRVNVYDDAPAGNPGAVINIQAQGTPGAGDYYIIKSVTYEPYE